jgi:hypothetical protein
MTTREMTFTLTFEANASEADIEMAVEDTLKRIVADQINFNLTTNRNPVTIRHVQRVEPKGPDKLYTWDEIGNMITEWDPHELHEMDRDGGWETKGWVLDTDVRVVGTDRHLGLTCWAKSQEEAHTKFMQTRIYRECNT